ncbi:hypothetical protein NLU13_4883 [Sarocladium strictum]|uniref:Uncharacterized protein n=1 Tax=Sarocladium strictum TaxID=5046 RepID=A0AA39L989_SARSR|nr:hypothetical protein NLU13_4883 [Sarocladium strictum]
MAPPGEKRGPDEPGSSHAPTMHKRVRSTGGGTDDPSSMASEFFDTPSPLPHTSEGFNFSTPLSGNTSRHRPVNQGLSHAARRIREQSEVYTMSEETNRVVTYTPVKATASSDGYVVGGSSRHMPEELEMAGFPLKEVGLGLRLDLDEDDAKARSKALDGEIEIQKRNPPVLPRSDVPELAPKTAVHVLLPVPAGATAEERQQIELQNNEIALLNKAKDRERNNQAAKKSRELRIESLERTRDMLIESTAELNWLRLRLIASGDREALAVWESLRSSGMVERIAQNVRTRVDIVENKRYEEKKRKDSIARVSLNKSRSMARAASAQRLSRDRELASELDSLRRSGENSPIEPLHRADAFSPSGTPSRVLRYGEGQFTTPQRQSSSQDFSTPDLTWSLPSTGSAHASGGPMRGPNPLTSTPIYSANSHGISYRESPSITARRRQAQAAQAQSLADAMGTVPSIPDAGLTTVASRRQQQIQALAAAHAFTSPLPPPGWNMNSQVDFVGFPSDPSVPDMQRRRRRGEQQPEQQPGQQQPGQQQSGQQQLGQQPRQQTQGGFQPPYRQEGPPPHDLAFYQANAPPPAYNAQWSLQNQQQQQQGGLDPFGNNQSSFPRSDGQQ